MSRDMIYNANGDEEFDYNGKGDQIGLIHPWWYLSGDSWYYDERGNCFDSDLLAGMNNQEIAEWMNSLPDPQDWDTEEIYSKHVIQYLVQCAQAVIA